jgi:hypothetical protein
MRGKKRPAVVTRLEDYRTDQGARRDLCRRLCDHLSKGYSMECFAEISTNSLKSLLKDYREDFDMEKIDMAVQAGRQAWEQIGARQASGSCLGNSRSWWLNMAVRYGWTERQAVDVAHSGQVAVSVVNYASNKPSQSSLSATQS